MTQNTGVCKYCGQMRIVQLSEDKFYTQAEIDNIVASECDCDVAKIFRKRTMAYGNLRGKLNERMPDEHIDEKEKHIKNLILDAAKLMSETYIDSISITSGQESYSLSLTPKITYKFKIKSTEVESMEA